MSLLGCKCGENWKCSWIYAGGWPNNIILASMLYYVSRVKTVTEKQHLVGECHRNTKGIEKLWTPRLLQALSLPSWTNVKFLSNRRPNLKCSQVHYKQVTEDRPPNQVSSLEPKTAIKENKSPAHRECAFYQDVGGMYQIIKLSNTLNFKWL